jgi:hypothetical protein
MSNINWNNFFNNNFSNNLNGFNNANRAGNLENTPLNPMPAQTNSPMQQHKETLEILLPRYLAQLSQTTNQLADLNQQQTVKMLKELLQMPKNFENFLTQLTTANMTPQQQQATTTALLLLASNMNMSQLANMLKNSSKEAMSNLYQMMAQFNQMGMSLKDEQLGQLTKLISFVAASTSSDVQCLRSTMLMYLPWLPLNDPNAFKLEIGGEKGQDASCDDDYITVLIATENYGNLQSTIYKTGEDGIKICLESSQTFPQEEFVALMREESIKHNININFELGTKEVFNKEKNEKSETQVYMNTSPGVNPYLLLISNSVIKNVHEIDAKENLKEQRKERVDGKS